MACARVRTARKDAAAAERASLEAGDAALKARLGRGAPFLVGKLLLGRERHVQKHLRRQDEHCARKGETR